MSEHDLTPEELDAIEARAQAATPGPWELRRFDDGWAIVLGQDKIVVAMLFLGKGRPIGEANTEHIAASRTDIPRLIAALRASWKREQRYRIALERIANHPGVEDLGGMDWQAGMVAAKALKDETQQSPP